MNVNIRDKKKICFIGNFYKTYFFKDVGDCLVRDGYEVYWILLKKSQYNFLVSEYKAEKLLLIDLSVLDKDNHMFLEEKYNELVFSDRRWKYDAEKGVDYLRKITGIVYDFIKQNNICYVFGELTWAHEILIHRMIKKRKELNCMFLSPHTIRIPNGRFAFFVDEKQSEIMEVKGSDICMESSVIKVEKPSYLEMNNMILAKKNSIYGRINRLKRFINNRNVEKSDPLSYCGTKHRLLIPIKEEINRLLYELVEKDSDNLLLNKRFVLYALHKQPEASVDVGGRYNEDQLKCIENIWRQLPYGWFLYVKEHSNALGDRSMFFYKKIKKMPNVQLISEKMDSHMLIKHAQLVVTITGTIALEAALLNVPSVTLTKMYFNLLNKCKYMSWLDFEGCESLVSLIEDINKLPDNRDEYGRYIMKNSFKGKIMSLYKPGDYIDKQNIGFVASAIKNIVE